MVGVVGVGGGDPGEHVLVAFARQQVAVLQSGLAELGQQGVAGAVDLHLAHQGQLGPCLALGGDTAHQPLANYRRYCRLSHQLTLHLVSDAHDTPKTG